VRRRRDTGPRGFQPTICIGADHLIGRWLIDSRTCSTPTHAPSIQFKATVGFDAFVISALLSPPDPNLAAQLRFDRSKVWRHVSWD
jgi:hypothetical protein